METNKNALSNLVMILVMLVTKSSGALDTSCVPTLMPCTKFLKNNTSNANAKPDAQCCSALSSVLKKDPQCLCDLITSDFMKQANIDLSEAMTLPRQCSTPVNASRCGHEKPASALAPVNSLDTVSKSHGMMNKSPLLVSVLAVVFVLFGIGVR